MVDNQIDSLFLMHFSKTDNSKSIAAKSLKRFEKEGKNYA